ncbi:hypothetical protein H0A58_03585 [Alcaligenaceae bacterium]|nr:hypothetical protein [Alcaligenaceae bacterium]
MKLLAIASVLSLVAACTSTGNSFNASGLSQFVQGQTTLDEAVVLLGADPVNTYRQLDGSATSIWSHKNSVMTDAIYINQELWLAFGPDGRFQRVVKRHNLAPMSPAKQPKEAVSSSASAQQAVVTETSITVVTPVVITPEIVPTASASAVDGKQAIVSYPINK